jgi:hypothetical protein
MKCRIPCNDGKDESRRRIVGLRALVLAIGVEGKLIATEDGELYDAHSRNETYPDSNPRGST